MEFDELDLETLVESDEVEAKEARGRDGKGHIPKSMWKAYSAFANSYGGWILLGVKERSDKSFEYLGVADPEKMADDLATLLEDKSSVSCNVIGRDDLFVVEHNGARLVVLRVPRADRAHRPVFIGTDPFKGTYKRVRDANPLCSRDEVQHMFADAAALPPSASVVPEYTLDDLDPETLARFRRRLREVSPDSVLLDGDDETLLLQLRVLHRDRKTKTLGVTLAGLLMFGRWSSIQEHLPYHHLDYRERSPGQERWSHRIHTDGTWSGNLYDFYRVVIRRLFDGLDVPFAVSGDMRIDDTSVHKALREALANTLSHAEHLSSRSIVIEKWPQKYIFRNPGRLRVPLEKIYEGGHTDPRNPILHQIFISLGIAERSGLGVPKILSAWEKQHWRKPLLSEDLSMEQTQLTLHKASLLPQEAVELVEQRLGPKEFALLTRVQRIILVTTCVDGEVRNEQLQSLTDMHASDLTRELQRFVELGYLERHGRGRGSSYRLSSRGDSGTLHLPFSVEPTSSPDKPTSSPDKPISSPDKPASSPDKQMVQEDEQEAELWDELRAIANPIRMRQRSSAADMRSIIVKLCKLTTLNARQLSELLGRKEKHLKDRYLSPLVEEGYLAYTRDSLTDPRQSYSSSRSR